MLMPFLSRVNWAYQDKKTTDNINCCGKIQKRKEGFEKNGEKGSIMGRKTEKKDVRFSGAVSEKDVVRDGGAGGSVFPDFFVPADVRHLLCVYQL